MKRRPGAVGFVGGEKSGLLGSSARLRGGGVRVGLRRAAGALLGLLFLAGPAKAQEKGKNVVTLREVVIVGRVQKPVASLDVNKIQPKLTLSELRQPLMDRIEAAVMGEPF